LSYVTDFPTAALVPNPQTSSLQGLLPPIALYDASWSACPISYQLAVSDELEMMAKYWHISTIAISYHSTTHLNSSDFVTPRPASPNSPLPCQLVSLSYLRSALRQWWFGDDGQKTQYATM